MTRKDYQLLADTIAQFNRDLAKDASGALTDTGQAIISGERIAAQTIAHRLAYELQLNNERFDRKRFIEACQLDAEFAA
jgi:hypothetical protein